MTDRMPSISDHRDDPGPVSPLEFDALQKSAIELEVRIRKLEAILLGSDPPPSDDGIDVTVSRDKGLRLRGRASVVGVVLVVLGVLISLGVAAKYWGPPARWQQQSSEGAGGR